MSKTVLITGASSGLGREMAIQLAEKNFQVLILARSGDKLDDLVKEIESSGGNAQAYVCDIRDSDQVKQTANQILKDHKSVDILVNNAGAWTDDNLQQKNPDLMNQALETNILGQVRVTEAFLPHFKQKNSGKIFNTISTSAVLGIPAGDNTIWKVYGASKWGIRGYTNALKESLRDTKIQVLQYFPGGFESDLYEAAGRDNPHNQPWMMRVEDVAEIAVFMLTRPDDIYLEQVVVSKAF